MTKMRWDKKRAEGPQLKRKRESVAVHPNSTAAKKWGRKEWRR